MPMQGLHVESCQFAVQHHGKPPLIPLRVSVNCPVSEIDVEIVECRSVLHGRKDLHLRDLLRGT